MPIRMSRRWITLNPISAFMWIGGITRLLQEWSTPRPFQIHLYFPISIHCIQSDGRVWQIIKEEGNHLYFIVVAKYLVSAAEKLTITDVQDDLEQSVHVLLSSSSSIAIHACRWRNVAATIPHLQEVCSSLLGSQFITFILLLLLLLLGKPICEKHPSSYRAMAGPRLIWSTAHFFACQVNYLNDRRGDKLHASNCRWR